MKIGSLKECHTPRGNMTENEIHSNPNLVFKQKITVVYSIEHYSSTFSYAESLPMSNFTGTFKQVISKVIQNA